MIIVNIMMAFANWVWGWPLLIMTSIVAVFLSFKLGFFQFTHFGYVMKNTFGKIFDKGEGEGNIKPFRAACTALASTLGVGNIAGVSVAIATGGPGAVFWMWFIALLGLIVKFSEVSLGLAYRELDPETGVWHGGFYWYVKNGLGDKWKWIGAVWAIVLAVGMCFAPSIQVNSTMEALKTSFTVNPYVFGIIAAVLMGVVLLGGLKSVSGFAEIVVPFMAVAYIIVSIFVIVKFGSNIGSAFGLIFKGAFNGTAAGGGFLGSTLALAIRWGLARGIYSNEAGTGTAPLAHSSASVNHPCRQGLWGIFEVFFDTIVVCTMTALVVLCSGVWNNGLTGAALTTSAFIKGFGGNAVAGTLFVTVIIAFFAFTTAVVNVYYGQVCLQSLGVKKVGTTIYAVIGCVFGFVGAIGALQTLWTTFDFFYGVCVVLNLFVLFMLRKQITILCKDFVQKIKTGDWDATSEEAVVRLGLRKEGDATRLYDEAHKNI